MPVYNIGGIDVDFPFEAYDCQIVYMEKVIQSLQNGCNALLESPTGTGKTLCLLCSTLAWRKSLGSFSTSLDEARSSQSGSQVESQRSGFPKILYTSRTHSQLKQVIRELKLSSYRPRMTILGSRAQLCIHDDVRTLEGRTQDKACQRLCKKRACIHHSRVSEYTKKHPELGNEPLDIEDLVNVGKAKGPCPYYVSRELHKGSDIIFAPYNYLIDRRRRESLSGISWRDTILIFDEAHNLESICAEAASVDLPCNYLSACISEAQQCIDYSTKRRSIERSAEKNFDPEQYAILKALLSKLDKRIGEVVIESKELGFTRPGPYIYDFLSDLNINMETSTMLISTLNDAIQLLEEANLNAHKMKGPIFRLEGFKDILEIIFRDGGKGHSKFYRFHVQESHQKVFDTLKGTPSRTLSWWCFNPGIAMEEFARLGVRSIILTSGTLSPLDSFALELKLEFPIRLENPHVISSDQVWAGVVSCGPSGVTFNSSFHNRDSLVYKQELGNAIVNFARIVPDGLLVFFPSYYLMDQCIDCWKSMSHANAIGQSTIWERICKNKQPVIEPKQSALFAHAIEDFNAKLQEKCASGAIFFAVCRGKVSEGLDFADHAGRAVVITGMPFAMRKDPKVRLKREYLDQQGITQKKDSKILTGEEWYSQQAARAVNQAVGRVIRHRHDYGAIIFCDERFTQKNHQSQMSYWMRPYVKCFSVFGDAIFTITRFFRGQDCLSLTKPLQRESSSIGDICDLKSHQSQGKRVSSDNINCPVDSIGENFLKNPVPSSFSSGSSNTYHELAKVVAANRANLSGSEKRNIMSKQSRNILCTQKRFQTFDERSKTIHTQECEIIDLTRDAPLKDLSADVIIPCLLKKSKISRIDDNLLQNSRTSVFSDHAFHSNLDSCSEKFSFDSDSVKYDKRSVSSVACDLEDTGVIDSNCNKHIHDCTTTMKNHTSVSRTAVQGKQNQEGQHIDVGDSSGSAFLEQVREKLTTTEYKEFIGLMKALKSKTMKMIPVLESIARLFSSPGRLFLLKRFKDYVPVKYQSFYQQQLETYETRDGNQCDICDLKCHQSQGKRVSSDNINCPVDSIGENFLKNPVPSSFSSGSSNTYHELAKVVAANRANLSGSEKRNIMSKQSRNILCTQKRFQTFDERSKTIHTQECEIIDLTRDAPLKDLSADVIIPCLLKKSKISRIDDNLLQNSRTSVFSDHAFHSNLDSCSEKFSFDSDSVKYDKRSVSSVACDLEDTGVIDSNCNKHIHDCTTTMKNHTSVSRTAVQGKQNQEGQHIDVGDSSGSAFLEQVREKLTTTEYKEFIGLMKALKSKTMKMIPVLESIARLFSSPGRLFLLKRFKD